MTTIEHLNITVPSIQEALKFINIVAKDFKVRFEGEYPTGRKWVHVGNDTFYIALQEPSIEDYKSRVQTYNNVGINHIGLVVQNIDEIDKELMAEGYEKLDDFNHEEFRKRKYFLDGSGIEWELIEYLSEAPSQKFKYDEEEKKFL